MKQLKMTRLDAEELESTGLEVLENKPSDLSAASPLITDLSQLPLSIINEENAVVIDGVKIEIKPTKFKYARNMFTAYMTYIKKIPIADLIIVPAGTISKNKSGDQILFDFLVAVFDDPNFVQDHYNNMDADLIERIIEIYDRVNHIKEREEAARKNPEAQTTA